jgi:uncharacterized protein YebE (UPF0316 family)
MSRIIDVSLGTIRVIFITRGFKYLAPLVGFFEVLIWLIAIGQIMKNLANPLCYVAYAGGFATGTFVGIMIAEKLSLGVVLIRILVQENAAEIIESLKSAQYGFTSVEGEGARGQVKVIFTIVPRRVASHIVQMVKRCSPEAFYTIEEVGFVEKGIFPKKSVWDNWSQMYFFRPFRKGK